MNEWININDKSPPAHKPFFGLIRKYNELKPVIFCRRGKIKDKLFQDYNSLTLLQIEYWKYLDLPK